MGFGIPVKRDTLHPIISNISYDTGVINIIMVDEIQSYFPKDTKDKITLQMIDQLTGDFPNYVSVKHMYSVPHRYMGGSIKTCVSNVFIW